MVDRTGVPIINGPLHRMTGDGRCNLLPTSMRLVVRHLVDLSSPYHFSSEDSSRDSSSSSSSKTSSNSSTDALSDSASSHSSSDHSLPTPSSGMRPSHHFCSFGTRLSSPTALSIVYAPSDLLHHTKRIRDGLGVDFGDESSESSRHRGTDLEMDVDVVGSDGIDIDLEIQAEIDECITYVDALRDRGIDAKVEGAVKVTYETLGDLVQRFHDHTKEIPIHRVQLERVNMRLRDMVDVVSQRVARS
ncbi:hypothetical protein Tco_0619695 [Tanacetum coccineum]